MEHLERILVRASASALAYGVDLAFGGSVATAAHVRERRRYPIERLDVLVDEPLPSLDAFRGLPAGVNEIHFHTADPERRYGRLHAAALDHARGARIGSSIVRVVSPEYLAATLLVGRYAGSSRDLAMLLADDAFDIEHAQEIAERYAGAYAADVLGWRHADAHELLELAPPSPLTFATEGP